MPQLRTYMENLLLTGRETRGLADLLRTVRRAEPVDLRRAAAGDNITQRHGDYDHSVT